MRTLDIDYLATHPKGEERAQFQLNSTIPSREQAPDNPDGSRPRVFIDVEADTYLDALSALSSLYEQKWEPAVDALVSEACTPEEVQQLMSDTPEGNSIVAEKLKRPVTPSRATPFEVVITKEAADGTTTESSVNITITAPSVYTALGAARHLSSPQMLQNSAITFCPETDDEDYDSNDVLVIPRRSA